MNNAKGAKVDRHCQHCRITFQARVADVKRGWAKFCSKRCKASEQESRTGQYENYQFSEPANCITDDIHDIDMPGSGFK